MTRRGLRAERTTMRVIGITGGSGSGKSLLSRIFAEKGIVSLDTDAVYHYITDHAGACVEELTAAFGDKILNTDRSLNRRVLADIVFHNDAGRDGRVRLLGEITHKYVRRECTAWLRNQEKSHAAFAVLDVPLLFESGFDALCDITIAVLASRETRLARIVSRDGIPRERAEARISAQPDEAFYRARADYVLRNDGDMAAFRREAAALFCTLGIDAG